MNTPILVIEAPQMSDEAAANAQELLFMFTEAFSAYYYHQIERNYFRKQFERAAEQLNVTKLSDNEDPF